MTLESRLFIACALALATAGAALALLLRIAKPLGLLDVPGGRKTHVGAVAMVGGLAATCGLLVAGFWLDGLGRFDRTLLATAAALVVIGAIDDRRNLSVRVRVVFQIAVILVMVFATGIHVRELGNLYGIQANLGWFGIPFTVVALVGLLNAFNLVDGIDGLAIGLTWVAIAAILLSTGMSHAHGTSALLVLLGCALVPVFAANLGWFGPRAKCFLGDAGSTLIGYVVGWALIAYGQQPHSGLSPVGTLWCVALPILDTLAVMYRRAHQHRNPFKPDRGHIHHLLMNAGYGPRATLAILLVVAAGIWGAGMLIHHLNLLGAGSNIAAFCAMIVLYSVVTERVYNHQQARLQPRVAKHGAANKTKA